METGGSEDGWDVMMRVGRDRGHVGGRKVGELIVGWNGVSKPHSGS